MGSTMLCEFVTSLTVRVDELRAGLNLHDIPGCWAMPGLSAETAALVNDDCTPNYCTVFADDQENCIVVGVFGDVTGNAHQIWESRLLDNERTNESLDLYYL